MRRQKRTDALRMSSRVPLLAPSLLLFVVAASSHATSNGAGSSADSRITVTEVAGDVDVTMAGDARSVSPNSTVLLPARIVTGRDGTLGLTQAGTNISVSNDTDVEIPAEAVDGNLVARLVQHRGNVFYDVAPRDVGKLRVETPFLVAVIKGTQFNVSVDDGTTTISLFEGRLELLTPEDGDVVELNAGEIAIRSLIDDSIRVIGMDDLRVAAPLPPAARSDAEAASSASPEGRARAADEAVAARVDDVTVVVDTVGADANDESPVVVRPPTEATVVGTAVLTGIETTVDLPVDIDWENPGVGVGPDRESSGLGIGRDRENPGLGVGRSAVDVGAIEVDFGGGSVELPVDVGLDTNLDIGAPPLDVGVDVGADIGGANAVPDAGLDLGGALDLDTIIALDTVVDVEANLAVDNELELGPGRSDVSKPTPRGGPGGRLGALPQGLGALP